MPNPGGSTEARLAQLEKRLAETPPADRVRMLRAAPERAELLALRDRVSAVLAVTDDELAQAVREAADVQYVETTEPTTGGWTRVIERRWQSVSVGATMTETPRYLNPPDSPAWGAQGGVERRVERG